MTTDPDNKPTTEEQPAQAEVAPLDDFELPAARQEGTNELTPMIRPELG